MLLSPKPDLGFGEIFLTFRKNRKGGLISYKQGFSPRRFKRGLFEDKCFIYIVYSFNFRPFGWAQLHRKGPEGRV